MKERSPRSQREASADGQQGQNSHRDVTGDIRIAGKIEANLPPHFIKKYEASDEKNDAREDKRFIVEGITLALVFIVAVFGAIQTRMAIKSANAALDANNLSRTNFEAGQRAWVGVLFPTDDDHEGFFDPIIPGRQPVFHYKFKNFGNSPALHVIQHGSGWIIQPGSGGGIDWSSVKKRIDSLVLIQAIDDTIFNGDTVSLEPGAVNVGFPTDIAQINSGTALVILAGRIEYWDTFEGTNVHHTTWCVIYVPPAPGKFPGYRSCPIQSQAD